MRSNPGGPPAPVAVLLTHLYKRLSYTDTTLRPFAKSLGLTNISGGSNDSRCWDLDAVFSDLVYPALEARQRMPGGDWDAAYE